MSIDDEGPLISLNKLSDKVKKKLEYSKNGKKPAKKTVVDDDLQYGLDLLGGTQDDLNLINGYDDEEKEEIIGPNETVRDKKLGNEIDDYIKELGLKGKFEDEEFGDEKLDQGTGSENTREDRDAKDKRESRAEKLKESRNKEKNAGKDKSLEKESKEHGRVEDGRAKESGVNDRTKKDRVQKDGANGMAGDKTTDEINTNDINDSKRNKRKEKREKLKQRRDEEKKTDENNQNQAISNSNHSKSFMNDTKYSSTTNQTLIDSSIEWYKQYDVVSSTPNRSTFSSLSTSEFSNLFSKADNLLKQENSNYVYEDSKSTSQKQFMSQLLSAGTLSDKISALTLLIQESPLHSIKHLNTLLGLCSKKSKGSAMQAVAALKDLLVAGVLPDRKLMFFKDQPFSNDLSPRQLILYAFEDYLKNYYFKFIQQLEQLSQDTVPYIRSQSVLHILALLQSKPEQEVNLLRLGVNKLGDSDKKVASRVSYLILQLEQAHPGMKLYVVNAISELIFRPSSTYHARYYSVITLNQTILAHKDVEVANSLVKIYLQMFEKLLAEWDGQKPPKKGTEPSEKVKKPRWNKKGNKGKHGGERQLAKTDEEVAEQQASKLQGGILTGLNRAYPFSHIKTEVFDKHIDALYRGTHSSNFNTTIQALVFLYQLAKSEKSYTDRYYRTLYATLQDPNLVQSSKLRLYLNILFKSIRDDTEHPERMMAFAKRILQTTSHWANNGAATGMIYLMIQICKTLPFLRDVMFDATEEGISITDTYDGRQRNPLFAKAELTKVWEIIPLLHHFHPTVAYYAEALIKPDSSDLIKPDLDLHTLIHFLDKFVNRNPKQKVVAKGTSIMQPSAAVDQASSIIAVNGSSNAPMNSYDWSKIDVSKVNAEDRFFYHYFTNRKESKSRREKAGDEELDDIEEDEVWDAIIRSQPDLEGDDNSEEDIDLDEEDLEDDMSGEDVDFDDMSGEDQDLDDISGDEESDFDGFSDDELAENSDESTNEQGGNESESDDFDLNDLDDEDLVNSDEDVEETEISNKRSADQGPTNQKSKRRKLKELPVFAAAEDYAQYFESDED